MQFWESLMDHLRNMMHSLSTLHYVPSLWQLRVPLQETAHLAPWLCEKGTWTSESELAIMLPLYKGTKSIHTVIIPHDRQTERERAKQERENAITGSIVVFNGKHKSEHYRKYALYVVWPNIFSSEKYLNNQMSQCEYKVHSTESTPTDAHAGTSLQLNFEP